MFLKTENFYHPFTEEFLGFGGKEQSNENDTLFIIQDIDLYHQPVMEPITGIVCLAMEIIAVVFAGFIQIKVLGLAKREQGLLKEVTQIYSLSSLTCLPFILSTYVTDFIHPLNEIFGQWICTLMRFMLYLWFNIIISHSFVVAMLRYLFIIQEKRVEKYGKEKTKKLFIVSSILVPMLIVVWGFIENSEIDPLRTINRCNGIDHKVFLISTADINPYFSLNLTTSNSEDLLDKLVEIMNKTAFILKALLTAIMGLNLTEGFLYYKIFSHINRCVVNLEICSTVLISTKFSFFEITTNIFNLVETTRKTW